MLHAFALIKTETHFIHPLISYIAQHVRQRSHENGQAEFLLLQLVVHTDTARPVRRSKESRNQLFTVGLVAIAELGLKLSRDGIIPLGCSLNTQFTVQPELVGTYQIVMKLVGRCGAEAQLGIEQIFPLHLFTVIIVGKQLQVGKHGVSALTSLVPVVGDIVLGNLQ